MQQMATPILIGFHWIYRFRQNGILTIVSLLIPEQDISLFKSVFLIFSSVLMSSAESDHVYLLLDFLNMVFVYLNIFLTFHFIVVTSI